MYESDLLYLYLILCFFISLIAIFKFLSLGKDAENVIIITLNIISFLFLAIRTIHQILVTYRQKDLGSLSLISTILQLVNLVIFDYYNFLTNETDLFYMKIVYVESSLFLLLSSLQCLYYQFIPKMKQFRTPKLDSRFVVSKNVVYNTLVTNSTTALPMVNSLNI